MKTEIIIIIILVAFILNYIDITLGMGYGTMLTPVLLLFGFQPFEVVPAVLISGVGSLLIATLFNIILDNLQIGVKEREYLGLNWIFKKTMEQKIEEIENEEDQLLEMKKLTRDTQVIIIFSVFGAISSIVASFISVSYANNSLIDFLIQIYIVMVVVLMGIIILFRNSKESSYSLPKVIVFGVLAGMNKAFTGGGFGPLSVSGQLLSGRNESHAVASTTFSETVVSTIAIGVYIIGNSLVETYNINYSLILYLLLGAGLSSPLAAFTISKIKDLDVSNYIGVSLILVGLIYLGKIIFF